MKVTDRRSPLFIRHSGNFDLGLTIGERKKKRSISDFIFERNQEAWGCLAAGGGSSRELPDLFFFFFALIFQTAGSQEVLALRFCIIMCNTVKQNKTGTKKCTFIMKRHTVQICGQAFGTGGGYLINMSN